MKDPSTIRWHQCGVLCGKLDHTCLGDATHSQHFGMPSVCANYVAEHQKRYPDLAHTWHRMGRQESIEEES